MSTKNVIIVIFTILLVGLLSFVGVWTYKNWDRLKMAFNGTKIYTHEDLVNAKEDGYNEALEDQSHYINLINEYQSKIDALTIQKEQLINENEELFKNSNSLTIENNELNRLVNQYLNQIEQLQLKIDYYIQLLSQYDTENTAMVTFEFDGIAYDAQIVQIGSTTTVADPVSTDYVKFNYWTVNGERVDLSTYTIQEDTTFIANCTYYYDVVFYVDGNIYNSQIIAENGVASIPNQPIKNGYRFLGWSFNNVDLVDLNTLEITKNISLSAIFEKLFKVDYFVDDFLINSEYVVVNENLTYSNVPTKDRCTFLGWSIDKENIVDLTNLTINKDIALYAIFEYEINGTYQLVIRSVSGKDSLFIDFVISHDIELSTSVIQGSPYIIKNTTINLNGEIEFFLGIDSNNTPYVYCHLNFNKDNGEWNSSCLYVLNNTTLDSYVSYK